MAPLTLNLPGLSTLLLEGGEGRVWHLGRSHQNEVVVPDGTLSRHHARIVMHGGVPFIEDLASRNGTFINGERIAEPRPLHGGDEVWLGSLRGLVQEGSKGPEVKLHAWEDHTSGSSPSLVMPLDAARRAWLPGEGLSRTGAVIQDLQGLSLELIKDVPTEALLGHVLDHLWHLLHPWRAAILLKEPGGQLRSVASRGSIDDTPIHLSMPLASSALERREAVLFAGVGQDGQPQPLSGITSAIVTPLEFEGTVLGLLYLDARAPREAFTELDLGLASTFAHMASAKLEQARMREEALSRRKLDQELDLARHIQQGLLPGFPPEIPGYELHGINLPSRQVSGDLFGWWPREDGRWLLALADVSGKGLGPGLLMASLTAFLEAWVERDLTPDALAFQLSKALSRHTDGRRFVTAFLALFDPATGEVAYTNAGHTPGLLLTEGARLMALDSQGLPLAMLPGQAYGSGTVRLVPGDLLALYTDGISEAANASGEEYGMDRLQDFMRRAAGFSAEEVDARLMAELDAHAAGEPFTDDRTLLLLRRQ